MEAPQGLWSHGWDIAQNTQPFIPGIDWTSGLGRVRDEGRIRGGF